MTNVNSTAEKPAAGHTATAKTRASKARAAAAPHPKRSPALNALFATTILGTALSLAAVPAPARAQLIPPNSSGTLSSQQQGVDHSKDVPGDGGQLGANGGDAAAAGYDIQNPSTFSTPNAGATTIEASSQGGGGATGGYGFGGGYGGNGGVGGKGAEVTFTMEAPGASPTSVISGGTKATALDLESRGGAGGDGGGYSNTNGTGGEGGTGGYADDVKINILGNAANATTFNTFQAGPTASDPDTTAIKLVTAGGDAGDTAETTMQDAAHGGGGSAGGLGGDMSGTITANVTSAGFGIQALSSGGHGGQGGEGNSTEGGGKSYGGAGGAGGLAGSIYLTLAGGSVQGRGADAQGTGGTADAGGGDTVNQSTFTAGVLLQSEGGDGGNGGSADNIADGARGGGGGFGGNGGALNLNLTGMAVNTVAYNAPALVALSVGGTGGNGATAGSLTYSKAGNGSTGGAGGIVNVLLAQNGVDYRLVQTTGGNSDALVAQSIGGGGGYGGTITGGSAGLSASLGGNGGGGGDAGSVTINNGIWNGAQFTAPYVLSTTGAYAFGVNAQSVGGGGGRGGDATGANLGPFALTIGGKGATGGDADQVSVTNYGIIQTSGSHSVGVLSQSVGGGGGSGGGAISTDIGVSITAAVAVGGKGGTGGTGADVTTNNFKQVVTEGSDAYAILAQSVGGGGGNGGTSLAQTFAINPPDEPALTLTTAVGGNGGAGGVAGVVSVLNTGLVATQGDGSNAVFAQSVGGGGGNGGDASATSQANAQSQLTVSTAIGGKGASGGVGGGVKILNSGLITTLGEGAAGVTAQSVGGGGGNGGFGAANTGAYNSADGYSLQLTVTVGGQGGKGGDGGSIEVDNHVDSNLPDRSAFGAQVIGGSGQILTLGDNSDGVLAQSVGGGGGIGGDSVAQGSNGKINVNVAVGGDGGAGGQGGNVHVDNGLGAILTQGASSSGVFAQSVGGGGGKGGKATTGSGNDPQYSYPEFIADDMANAYGKTPNSSVQNVSDQIWDWKDNVQAGQGQIDLLKKFVSAYGAKNPGEAPGADKPSATDFSVDIGAGWGGAGGAAGDGGAVTVNNPGGAIQTKGAISFGVFAQSVGGGGGVGGASAPSTSNDKINGTTVAGSLAVGGHGGAAGLGGTASITNAGFITTTGDLSHGLFAQSIGGGGGVGGLSTPTAGLGTGIRIKAGGDSGASGLGGDAVVENSSQVMTSGAGAVGMLAQSIGGGGGLAALTIMVYDPTNGKSSSALGSLQTEETGLVQPRISGSAGENSSGGNGRATLDGSGDVITQGVNAYGILVQSIGGGGGLLFAGASDVNPDSLFLGSQDDGVQNNGGEVDVVTSAGAGINTSGNGAAGVVAQSIGGAGGIVNGLDGVNLLSQAAGSLGSRQYAGTGGQVLVNSSANIYTFGSYAHGIFAQSVGGSGGVIGRQDTGPLGYLFAGTPTSQNPDIPCGAPQTVPCTGDVVINVNAGTITPAGAHSFGVYGMSQGNVGGHNTVTVNVAAGANIILAGESVAAIMLNGWDANTVNNHGTINALKGLGLAVASVYRDGGPYTPFTVNNFATLIGSIGGGGSLGAAPSVGTIFNNEAGALFEPGPQVNVATLKNNGVVSVGGVGNIATATVSGDYVQGATGLLLADADVTTGAADKLNVNGKATVAGQVKLTSNVTAKAAPVTILTAAGGVTMASLAGSSTSAASKPFSDDLKVSGHDLQAQTNAHFNEAAASLGKNQQAVAAHLQEVWDSGASLATGFGGIRAANEDATSYARTLDSLAGQALGAIDAVRYRTSQTFVANMLDRCPDGVDKDGRCVWGRVADTHTSQNATRDALGYKVDGQSVQMGASGPVGDKLSLSGSFGYGQNDLKGNGGSKVKGEELRAGAMLTYRSGPWELSGALDAGHGSYDSTRSVAIGSTTLTATAKPKIWDVGAHLRAAYEQPIGKDWQAKPFVDLNASHVHSQAYTETGAADLSLKVDQDNDTVLSARTGVEFTGQLKVGKDKALTLRPFVTASVEALNNGDWAAKARFVGDDGTAGFKASTPLPNVLGEFVVGAELAKGESWSLKAQYGAEIGKDFTSQTGAVRVAVKF